MELFNLIINEFHFLRPWCLLLVIPAVLLFFVLKHYSATTNSWAKVIAPELLPFMLDTNNAKRRSKAWLWLVFWLLATIAIAGPTWQKIPLPVHKSQQPLVILFDLSPSMLVEDIKPNRLTRAKLKLIDLLKQREEGTTALISYAGEAFVVSPLTDDTNTIANMVPALHPNIIPLAGSMAEQALALALQLIANAGELSGDILFITDGINLEAADEINQLLRNKPDVRLSILGVGTSSGGPIPLGRGGFAKDANGSIVIPKLNHASLTKLAKRNGGLSVAISADNKDLDTITAGFKSLDESNTVIDERTTDTWHDLGFWLLLPLLPILMVMFRRGAVFGVLLIPFFVPQPAQAFGWQDLWLNKDQQAHKAFDQGDFAKAQDLYKNRDWQAASAYKNGDYEKAAELFKGNKPENHYNQGNALTQLGDYQEAIEAYDSALKQNPDMTDAKTAKHIAEQLLNQQQQQQEQEQEQEQNQDEQQSEDQNNSENSDSGEQNQDQSQQSDQNDQQSSESQSEQNDQQAGDKSDSDQNEDPNSQQQGEQNEASEQTDDQQKQEKQQAENAEPSQQPDEPAQLSAQPEAGELSDEERQQMEQWLRQIPDDPGGLLRRKFHDQSQKRAMEENRNLMSPPNKQQRW